MRIVRDSVLKELGAARQVFYGINVMHYAIDGVSASGDHNDIFMAWHPRKNTAWIGPPQVFESAKLRYLVKSEDIYELETDILDRFKNFIEIENIGLKL